MILSKVFTNFVYEKRWEKPYCITIKNNQDEKNFFSHVYAGSIDIRLFRNRGRLTCSN